MKDSSKLVVAGAALAGILAVLKSKAKKVAGIGAAKKYYVYAGYYENYISSEPMPAPYVLRRTFRSIDRAIDYAESFGDNVEYCENIKYDLPDYLYEWLQDHDYEYIKIEGVGKILENDFYGAKVTTKDGKHAVSFSMNGDDDIMVDAFMYYPENMNYGSDWDYWFHIGDYRTLAGAKRGAKRKMAEMGYELSDKDLNKI